MDANKAASRVNRLAQEKEAAAELADAHSAFFIQLPNMLTAPFRTSTIIVIILAQESAKVKCGFDENAVEIWC